MDPTPSGSGFQGIFLKRIELHDKMRNCGERTLEGQFKFLKEYLKNRTNCPPNKTNELYSKVSHFTAMFKYKWAKACRIESRFLLQNKTWLEESIGFEKYDSIPPKPFKQRGRPTLSFDNVSDRSKRLKIEDLRKNTSLSEVAHATKMKLRASGHSTASKLVQDIVRSPNRAKKYREAYCASQEAHNRKMSGEEALSTLVEAQLTTHQYNVIRSKDPERFPSYKVVQAAKKFCYPEETFITITPTSAEVTLQALLDHTTKRLINVQKDVVLVAIGTKQMLTLTLISKWGFDGSSGHSSYKQKCIGIDADDSSVFISSIVPMRLVAGDHKSDNGKILWQNPRPASTRYCRPIKINFIKESTDTSIAEMNRIEDQIHNLNTTSILIGNQAVIVAHELCFTMVDGKVCNALTDTKSTQRCYICGASSKELNNIEKFSTETYDSSKFRFGLSTLHSWIRCFECLLHVGYKLQTKTWQSRKDNKVVVGENKMRIQKAFKDQLGLIVDRPKPGYGNSNDGNTARRFFYHATVSSEITGVDENLIRRIHVILVTISSGYTIQIEKFRQFALDTAKLFVQLYPWFYMTPTVHKLLIHGPDVIAAALLPIGQLTEEAQEAQNKNFKKYREHYSRKCSREKCNEDVFKTMMIYSDPVITSYRKLPRKSLKHYPKEVFLLISAPDIPANTLETRETDEDGSSDSTED